jgi:hypothetical protein
VREDARLSLGVHFALTKADLAKVRAFDDPHYLLGFLTGDMEERYLAKGTWAYQSDKAWEPIHRCLGDGRLLYATGPFPLTYAVLGGMPLDAGDDYTACIVEAAQVHETSKALAKITKAWMRERYAALKRTAYRRQMSDEDFEYTWANFTGLRRFFANAARVRRAVVFTTDA